MVEPAAHGVRPSPRYGWLAAVIPASAERFRVEDPELAAALTMAGAELVDRGPDVEIGANGALRGDARCAIVPLRVDEPRSKARSIRGAKRFAGSAVIRGRSLQARRLVANHGYAARRVLTWDRGVAIRTSGTRASAVRTLAHRFPLNAVVVGARDGAEPTAFEAAMAAAEAEVGTPFAVESLLLAASGVIVAIGDDAVVRVGVGPAAERIAEQRAALEALRASAPPDAVSALAPWNLAYGRTGLAVWSAEHRLPGDTPEPRLTGRLVVDCLEFLVGLHETRGGDAVSLARSADVVAAMASPRNAAAIRELGARLDDRLAAVPRGFGHGDFWTGNLLVEDGRLRGVVDWPSATPGALPLLDLLHLKANTMREVSGRQLGSVIVDDLLGSAEAGGDDLVREYCRRTEIDPRPGLLVDLLSAYWLEALAHELLDPDRDPHQSAEAPWREVNIEYVLAALSSPRTAGSRRRDEGRPAPARTGERATVVTDPDELACLDSDWASLAERRGNPFISPDWYWAWLRTCGQNQRPFAPVLRDADGRLRGLVPLVISGWRGAPTLSFAGAPFGDYYHPAAAEGEDEEATARAAAQAIAARRSEWALFVADYVDAGASWLSELVRGGPSPLAVTRYHAHASIYRSAPLDGLSWEAYLESRSRNFRSQLGRKERTLAREHDVRFRRSDAETVDADMKTLFDLHQRRWGGRRTMVFASPAARDFHLEFARAALGRGWLRLWLLEVDGAPIAVWYGWRLGERYLYYQAGFDPAWGRSSPGLLLLAHTVREAIEEGASAYDMLLGDEAYKSRFADLERTAETVVLTRARHPARLLVGADVGLRRVARRLPRGPHDSLRDLLAPFLKRWPVSTAP